MSGVGGRADLCANVVDRVPCEHSLESHFEEQIPTDLQVPGGPRKMRTTCLVRGCDCRLYKRPKP